MITIDDVRSSPRFEGHLKYIEEQGSYSLEFFGGKFAGGARLQQNPEEFAAFLTFLGDHSVGLYLEVGSASGAFIKTMMTRLPIVNAVMIDDGSTDKEEQDAVVESLDYVTRFTGDSHSAEAWDFLDEQGIKYDLIFIDGDHSYEGVLQDIDLVLPYADQDTLIAFHDIRCQHVPGVGKAYDEAIAQGKITPIAEFVSATHANPLGIAVCKKL